MQETNVALICTYPMIKTRNCIGWLLIVCVGLCNVHIALAAVPTKKDARYWVPLAQDQLHDPLIAALDLLQNPTVALSKLPPDGFGNQVDWVKALENGDIRPRGNSRSDTGIKVLDLNVLRKNTGEMDIVLFPHKQHTEWMTCGNCHEQIFRSKAGATKFSMFDILNGEYCGRCHGAVAFPLTECKRCHSVPHTPMVIPARPH